MNYENDQTEVTLDLFYAIRSFDIKTVSKILDKNPNFTKEVFEGKGTLIEYAAGVGHSSVIKLLLKRGCEVTLDTILRCLQDVIYTWNLKLLLPHYNMGHVTMNDETVFHVVMEDRKIESLHQKQVTLSLLLAYASVDHLKIRNNFGKYAHECGEQEIQRWFKKKVREKVLADRTKVFKYVDDILPSVIQGNIARFL